MTTPTPTILATSGGFVAGRRTALAPSPLVRYAIELSGASSRPRFCYIGTASGDAAARNFAVHEAFYGTGVEVTCLNLLPQPNIPDPASHLRGQDVIWVGGGSVAGLLSLWRLHGLDEELRAAWTGGVVLAGISAGSVCWHVGGTTDSFGPDLRPVVDGLAFLPYSNGVHYDSEEQRRPLFHRLIGEGVLPRGYATDDGVGLLYRGIEMVEAVSQRPVALAYHVEADGEGGATETPINPRLLG